MLELRILEEGNDVEGIGGRRKATWETGVVLAPQGQEAE